MFYVVCDDTRDISGVEQLSRCIRWVDDNLEPHGSFIGLRSTSTSGEVIASIIADVLTRVHLPFSMLRGQSYDGAPNMSGSKQGVQSIVEEKPPLAIFVHCGAHCINLITKECCDDFVTRNAMHWTHELDVLLCKSIKQN
ncbi:hypothetical protein PR048_007051 [Dryococelus australis]|uniref:DUF4371 domain-containing protein n=1 Tax=Dryococelus australis TaxID=614101 RepID=A0ABQ9IDW2_9NEOP|nr:hypothetical protein PR048_007051 [Dryococelus australis]